MVAKFNLTFEQYLTAINAGSFKEISITEVSENYVYPKVENPEGSTFHVAIIRPKFEQKDLPVGYKVYMLDDDTDEEGNDIYSIKETYIMGNYDRLSDGEVRTAWAGMQPTTKILGIAENPEADFLRMRQAIQEFKTAVNKKDKDSYNVCMTIYDFQRDVEETPIENRETPEWKRCTAKWLTSKKGINAHNTLLLSLGSKFYEKSLSLSWFEDYMWPENMPARIGK
jgi:hypothetical protein